MVRVCRHCGARLSSYFGAGEECWYCHRPLSACDIVGGQEKIEPQPPDGEAAHGTPATGAGCAAGSGGPSSTWLDRFSGWNCPDWLQRIVDWFKVAGPSRHLGCFGATTAVAVIGFTVWYSSVWYSSEEDKWFREMTPATHLTQAKAEFRGGLFGLALRHLKAVPSGAPEAPAARQMESEIRAAQQSDEAARAAARQAEAAAKLAKDTAVRDLQDSLKNLGYDVTVTRSDVDDEIVITSGDFGDTDHRVRLLSFLRSESSPAFGVCVTGFRTVRLKAKWSFVTGHGEAYSLNCR